MATLTHNDGVCASSDSTDSHYPRGVLHACLTTRVVGQRGRTADCTRGFKLFTSSVSRRG